MSIGPEDVLLASRTAIVTGGAQGIGRGIAEALAAFGADVIILDLNAEAAARTAGEIAASGGSVETIPGDARDPAAFQTALEHASRHFAPVRILVNNVGGVFAAPFLDSVEKGWDALIRANLKTVLHGTQQVGRHMRDHGQGGSIVNVVSIEGGRAAPSYAVYAAAKAAVVNFTQSAALELAPHHIRVNALAPDICMTEGLRALVPEDEEARAAQIVPVGRAGTPDDVAGAAVFLASDLARYVTGVTLAVDGGTQAGGGWYRGADGGWVLGPPRRS
jgi:NAD(P)-dependent dehydrogenase (short-subunit alcohol dehydrogenase family)